MGSRKQGVRVTRPTWMVVKGVLRLCRRCGEQQSEPSRLGEGSRNKVSKKMKSVPKLMCLNDLRPDLYCWWGIGE